MTSLMTGFSSVRSAIRISQKSIPLPNDRWQMRAFLPSGLTLRMNDDGSNSVGRPAFTLTSLKWRIRLSRIEYHCTVAGLVMLIAFPRFQCWMGDTLGRNESISPRMNPETRDAVRVGVFADLHQLGIDDLVNVEILVCTNDKVFFRPDELGREPGNPQGALGKPP